MSKRRGELRHTREGERFDDFDIRQEWWTGDALPDARVVRRELAGVPKVEVVGLSKEKVEELYWDTIARSSRSGGRLPGNDFRLLRAVGGQQWAWRLDFSARGAR